MRHTYMSIPIKLEIFANPEVQQPAGLVDRAKAGDVKAIELMSSGMLATFGRPLKSPRFGVVKKKQRVKGGVKPPWYHGFGRCDVLGQRWKG